MFNFFVGFTDRHEGIHFFPYPDRTRPWIGVYMKNIFKWKKSSFAILIPLWFITSFVCFYLTKKTFCSLLQPWSGYAWPKKLLLSTAPVMVQFMQNEPHTNRHKPPFLLLCWICSIHQSASSCLLRPSTIIIIINISNEVWSIFGSIFRIKDRICTRVKRM